MCKIFDIFNIYLKVKRFKYAWILPLKRRFEPYSLPKQDHKILYVRVPPFSFTDTVLLVIY